MEPAMEPAAPATPVRGARERELDDTELLKLNVALAGLRQHLLRTMSMEQAERRLGELKDQYLRPKPAAEPSRTPVMLPAWGERQAPLTPSRGRPANVPRLPLERLESKAPASHISAASESTFCSSHATPFDTLEAEDSLDPPGVKVQGRTTIGGVVHYQVHVWPAGLDRRVVLRRYKRFLELQAALAAPAGPFPGKLCFCRGDRALDTRELQLNDWLQAAVRNNPRSADVTKFLRDFLHEL